MIFRLVAMSFAFALLTAMPAAGQQQHWLLGFWDGELSGLAKMARGSPQRTLRVLAVAPDGTAGRGTFGTGSNTQNVALKISGDTVDFSTPGSNGFDHRLNHRAGVLEGVWTIRRSGTSGQIRLKKN